MDRKRRLLDGNKRVSHESDPVDTRKNRRALQERKKRSRTKKNTRRQG